MPRKKSTSMSAAKARALRRYDRAVGTLRGRALEEPGHRLIVETGDDAFYSAWACS